MNECAQYPRVMILNAGADHADGVRQKRIGCSARFRALLLEEVGTDDGHFSDLTPVHQLWMADDVSSIAGWVTAKVAKEELIGTASSTRSRSGWMIGDPLSQLKELQSG